MAQPLRVTVWNEHRHEKRNPRVREVYPAGIHEAVAGPLRQAGFAVRTATLDEPEHGLGGSVLDDTDVLVWWGHLAHGEVSDEVAARVQARVLGGMGLVALHSAHFSKVFMRLMGTTCALDWREAGERQRVWVVDPAHPIAAGIDRCFELAQEEMYGEDFDIPAPDELVFITWFEGGEVFRSGCCFHRGRGRIFYFQPGHEIYPSYHDANVQRVIANGVRWAAPQAGIPVRALVNRKEPPEPLGRRG